MASIKFTGEIVQEGREFVIKTEISLPSQDQAMDFAKWLHDTIVQHVESKGATVKRESPLILHS
jgi:hypothetical protein